MEKIQRISKWVSKVNLKFHIKMLHTLKGKLMLLSTIALGSIALLGVIIMWVLNVNNKDYKLTNIINDIKVKHYQNQNIYTEFYMGLQPELLKNVYSNLEEMNVSSGTAKKLASGYIKDEMQTIEESLVILQDNVQKIGQLGQQRGFTGHVGLNKEFSQDYTEVVGQLEGVGEPSWIEVSMLDVDRFNERKETINGTTYTAATYTGQLPHQGRREHIVIRLGGNVTDYSGNVWINNITLGKENEELVIDLKEHGEQENYWIIGDGYSDVKYETFNNLPSIGYKVNYSEANGKWEEVALHLPIEYFNIGEYDYLKYDIYYTPNDAAALLLGSSINHKYAFGSNYYNVMELLEKYSTAVAKGDVNWASEDSQIKTLQKDIYSRLEEIQAQLLEYLVDEEQRNYYIGLIESKKSIINEILNLDAEILDLKAENIILETTLLETIESMTDEIYKQMNSNRLTTVLIILLTAIVVAAVVFTITIIISRGIQGSVKEFEGMLNELSKGNLSARAELKTKDEFGQFVHILNNFADKLSATLGNIQVLVNEVEDRNKTVADTTQQIVNGAEGYQNAKIEKGILQLKQIFNDITDKVSTQSANTEEAFALVRNISGHNEELLTEMKNTKESAVKTLDKVHKGHERINTLTEEIANINESVGNANNQVCELINNARNIGDILEAIKALSSQTDLLALNASIEASRAGESGRGFAVVAGEIKKLSEQTRDEADKISASINEINANINKVQSANKKVELNVQETLNITEHFNDMMNEIREFTELNADNVNTIYDTINEQNTRLQNITFAIETISQEATQIAYSTEDTMTISSDISNALVDNMESVDKVMDISGQLKQDMSYFRIQ